MTLEGSNLMFSSVILVINCKGMLTTACCGGESGKKSPLKLSYIFTVAASDSVASINFLMESSLSSPLLHNSSTISDELDLFRITAGMY